ncbi:MAG: glycosyltransferase [Agriterribacter sp.]
MKILYIHQYFVEPNQPGGTRSYWIAKELIKNGHEVIMLTSAMRGQEKFLEKKDVDGISVIYVRNKYNSKMGTLSRLFSFLRFMMYSVWFGLRQKNVNLVFATSTPLTVAIPALFIKWFKKVPFIFEVRDLCRRHLYKWDLLKISLPYDCCMHLKKKYIGQQFI